MHQPSRASRSHRNRLASLGAHQQHSRQPLSHDTVQPLPPMAAGTSATGGEHAATPSEAMSTEDFLRHVVFARKRGAGGGSASGAPAAPGLAGEGLRHARSPQDPRQTTTQRAWSQASTQAHDAASATLRDPRATWSQPSASATRLQDMPKKQEKPAQHAQQRGKAVRPISMRMQHDTNGRILLRDVASPTGHDVFQYAYDAQGHLTDVACNGMHVESYRYNDKGQRVEAVDHRGVRRTFRYDGRLMRHTRDPSQQAEMHYTSTTKDTQCSPRCYYSP